MTIRKLRALAWRIRYLLLALVAITALAAVLQTLSAMRPDTARVVVAARGLDAGIELAASDIRLAAVPENLVPDGAIVSKDDAIGSTIAAGLPEGMPLASSLLLGEDFLASAPKGHTVLPVTVASDAATGFARPGSTIALYAPPDEYSDSTDAVLVADKATVIGVAQEKSSGGLFGTSGEATLALFVAVPDARAPAVLGASSSSPLLVVSRR